MPPPTFYVETSVWGCLAPQQPRDRKRIVQQLLRLLDGERGICVVSSSVLDEISAAPSAVVSAIRPHVESVRPMVYEVSDEAERLARCYLDSGVLPENRETDAIHVAVATCLGGDYLVSWNHKHITSPKKRLRFEAVNRLNGFLKSPLICNPLEACDDLRSR